MKKVTMFIQRTCPYCKAALAMHEKIFAAHPELRDVELETVDELAQPERADKYDYYYVPTYFVGDEKLHEGAASEEKVLAVFQTAYGS